MVICNTESNKMLKFKNFDHIKWPLTRKWQMLFFVSLLVNIALVGSNIYTFQNRHTDIGDTRSLFETLNNITPTYKETPIGLKRVSAKHGVSKEDLDFLKRYRGPLLPVETTLSDLENSNLLHTLKDRLSSEFEKQKQFLMNYIRCSERQALIAFALLRTNGSMPTYEVRMSLPNDLRQLIIGPSGNCSDYTVRLMMILEAFGLHTVMISNVTTNLLGHVFVDAYDSEDDTSYLLDANFNVMIIRPNSNKMGFIENLFAAPDTWNLFSEQANIVTLPVYFRFLDPGETGYMRTPLTPEFLNEHRGRRESMWRSWLKTDVDELRSWWIRTPTHAPKTLHDLSLLYSSVPKFFNVSGEAASRLKRAAGLINNN